MKVLKNSSYSFELLFIELAKAIVSPKGHSLSPLGVLLKALILAPVYLRRCMFGLVEVADADDAWQANWATVTYSLVVSTRDGGR